MAVLTDHFDMESLQMLREVMEDEFPDLIQVYIDDSSARLPEIRLALQRQDARTLRDLAHSFKGASSNISAAPLARLCYELEISARDNQLGGLEPLLDSIEQEYHQIQRLLNEMI